MNSTAPAAATTGSIAVTEKPSTVELELENTRLQKLIADLLARNQQLRLELKLTQRALSY